MPNIAKVSVHLLCLTPVLGLAAGAQAALLDDSKGSLDLRNFYMNRDFRQSNATQAKAEEWGQGFQFRFESGFTPGALGFGLDATGLLGLKLDSSPDRVGTGLLKSDKEAPRRAQDEYGELAVTAKARLAKSTLKVGTLQPILPPLMRNDSRLLPQTYRGAWLTSNDVDNLTLDAAKLDRVNQRDSSDNEKLSVYNAGKRNIVLGRTTTSDDFLFAGGKYQWSPELSGSYYFAALDGIYQQHLVNLVHQLPLGPGQSFKSDIRFARSVDDGGSNVDNDAIGALFTYRTGAHAFSAGYQYLTGDTGFAFVNGADNALLNQVQINDFGNKDEQSWQVRYDYDFVALGIPGLTLMTRYLSGDNVDRGPGLDDGKTWERNTDIGYVIQSGPLKNVAIKWRNATTRSNFLGDLDENRLFITYSLPLW
ncbi:hypothetical protein AB7M33_003850 [Pseudomonas sp. Y3 TE3536]